MLNLLDRMCIAVWGWSYRNVDASLFPAPGMVQSQEVDLPMPSYKSVLIAQAIVFAVAWLVTK